MLSTKREQNKYIVLLRIDFFCLILIKYNAQSLELYFKHLY
jgi:hypothetical protein